MKDRDQPAPTESNQGKRFAQAARELGCDESEERFDAALGKIVKHKPAADPKPPAKAGKAGPK